MTWIGDNREFFDNQEHEEINIDWMRKSERKIVMVGNKKYYEDQLAEALSNIEPVG